MTKPAKIAIICSTFPPDRCGVGDYSGALTEEFVKMGHHVGVWSCCKNPESRGARHHHVESGWSQRALSQVAGEISSEQPNVILFQYTPSLYVRRGVHLGLPLWISDLKRAGRCPVFLGAHELNYPVELSPRGLLLGIPQYGLFLALASIADRVLFTYEASREWTLKVVPWKKEQFSWLPVGSNVPYVPIQNPRSKIREDLVNKKLLVHFGGLHPTHLLGHMVEALNETKKKLGDESAVLVFAGAERKGVLEVMRSQGLEIKEEDFHAAGYLSPEDISLWLQAADCVVSPFMDGISTRRGSAMAAFLHGSPVATTSAWSTNMSVDWRSFCRICPSDERLKFAQLVSELVSNGDAAEELGKMARKYYFEHFDWGVIASSILNFI